MAVPSPRRRGGVPLMLLGVILALATAVLVLFLTNGNGSALSGGGATVLVASRNLTTGMVLSASNGATPYIRVADAFHVAHVPAAMVPADAYTFTSQADLAAALNGQTITSSFLAGDILRRSDQRMSALGGPPQSLVNHNPTAIPDNDVLFTLHTGDAGGMQIDAHEGDHVDILATMSGTSAKNSGQLTQTTLQNLVIYAMTDSKTMIFAVSHEDALVLKLLVETAKLDLVLRKPGDTTPANTQAVDPAWVMSHFNFTPPSGS